MINVSIKELEDNYEKGVDEFLKKIIDEYLRVIGEELTGDNMDKLNGHQHSLLGYYFFRKELMDGGFIQLIQNGYGPYIFDNPFGKAMRLFGAKEFSKLVYKAKEIYDKNKADLTKDCSEEEFMAMYEQYEIFDELEERFMEMEEEVTNILAEYVREHLTSFIDEKKA